MRQAIRSTSIAALLTLFALAGTQASTAKQEETYPFPVHVLLCERDPGRTGPYVAGFPPEGCAPRSGVEIVVETADAQPIGHCTTDETGSCVVEAPFDSLVIVTEEVSALPPGSAPKANPILTWVYTEFAGAEFINVPDPDAPATPPADAATLTVHSRVCPAGFTGPDYGRACHGTPPSYPQTLFLSGPEYRAARIDDDGNVSFPDLAPGTYELRPGLPEATDRVVVFCAEAATPGVEVPSETLHSPYAPPNDYVTRISLDPADRILCDLFAVPASNGGSGREATGSGG